MTTDAEVLQWIQDGEGSAVDFKESGILSNNTHLAKLMVAFANTLGGKIVIGVRDNMTFENMTFNARHQTHVTNIARTNVDPPITLQFEHLTVNGNCVYVITIPRFTVYPHALKTSGGKIYYIRENDSVREPSPQEMTTLFAGSPNNVTSEIRELRSILENIQNHLSKPVMIEGTLEPVSSENNVAIGLIRTFISRWTGFVNAPEQQIGSGIDDLNFFLIDTSNRLTTETAFNQLTESSSGITDLVNRLRTLGHKQFFIDGGKSWNEFIEEGNNLVTLGHEIITDLGG